LLWLFFLSLLDLGGDVCDSFGDVVSELLRVDFIVTGDVALREIPFSHELVSPPQRHSSPLLRLLITCLALLNLLVLRVLIFILSGLFNGETLS